MSVRTLYSAEELKPYMAFRASYCRDDGWHGISSFAGIIKHAYKSDGSQGYPAGTLLIELDDDDFYFMEARLVEVFFKLTGKKCKDCIYCKDMNSGNLKCSKLRDIVDSDFYCKKWEKK